MYFFHFLALARGPLLRFILDVRRNDNSSRAIAGKGKVENVLFHQNGRKFQRKNTGDFMEIVKIQEYSNMHEIGGSVADFHDISHIFHSHCNIVPRV